MGDIFSLGFGPFRWVCTSNAPADLRATDAIAAAVLRRLRAQSPPRVDEQLADNLLWIEQAERNQMVVGSQVRAKSIRETRSSTLRALIVCF
jgi:urocanate hydratase